MTEKKTDIKEVKLVKLYNKSTRAFSGVDTGLKKQYVFLKDSSFEFSEDEALKLLEFYPDEILAFDGVNVIGISEEKYNKAISDLQIANTKLQAAEVQIDQLKAEVERYKKDSTSR